MTKDINAIEARLPVQPPLDYPQEPIYHGADAPCRFEAEVYHCQVFGEIPKDLDGTYYRTMPDPVWNPGHPNDNYLNGDGVVGALRFFNGHVDFKQRFVRTRKFVIERAARKNLFGKFRNRFTADARVENEIRSTGNTHVILWNKQLIALKEDSVPYALDPNTLDTIGVETFQGQLTSKTFNAHPKIDPVTGELINIGYEAKGDGTNDISYFVFDKNGKKTEECWFKAPFVCMTHDIGVTENWIVVILPPLVYVPDELQKQGHSHFAWDATTPMTFGMFPRRSPKPEDIRWFTYEPAFGVHAGNAYEDANGIVCLDMPIANWNRMFYFPALDEKRRGVPVDRSRYMRFHFDPRSPSTHVDGEVMVDIMGEFPTIDNRFATKSYRYTFLATSGAAKNGTMNNRPGNGIAMLDLETHTYTKWCAGEEATLTEASFVPRNAQAPEGDGYLICIINRKDRLLTSAVILDCLKLQEGPVAIVNLPFRLRTSTHGFFALASEIGERRELCDMSHVTPDLLQKFGADRADRG